MTDAPTAPQPGTGTHPHAADPDPARVEVARGELVEVPGADGEAAPADDDRREAVEEPAKVMRELARVCKVGGQVILVNHFSQEDGVRGWVERRMAPFGDKLGWRPVFDVDQVMVCDNLKVVDSQALRPWGLFTMLRFEKTFHVPAKA